MGAPVRGEPLDVEVPPAGARGKSKPKKSPFDESVVAEGLCAVFGALGFATGHDHWIRTPAQVGPIAEPLCRMLDKLSPAAKKNLEKYYDPVALGVGLVLVAGPSLNAELAIYQGKRQRGPLAPAAGPAAEQRAAPVPTGPVDPGAVPVELGRRL